MCGVCYCEGVGVVGRFLEHGPLRLVMLVLVASTVCISVCLVCALFLVFFHLHTIMKVAVITSACGFSVPSISIYCVWQKNKDKQTAGGLGALQGCSYALHDS